MSVAIITDGRGAKRDACGALHAPTIGWRAAVSPEALLLVVLAVLVATVSPPMFVVLLGAWIITWLLCWFLGGRQRAAILMAAEGKCACCEYEIAGLPPESDDCTVCPECGAAWRVDA